MIVAVAVLAVPVFVLFRWEALLVAATFGILVRTVVGAMVGWVAFGVSVHRAIPRVTVRAGDPTRLEFVLEHDGPAEREALSDVVFALEALHD